MRLIYFCWLVAGLLFVSGVTAQDYVGLTEKAVQLRLKKETRDRSHVLGAVKTYIGSRSRTVDLQLNCDSTGLCYAEQYLCKDESSALQWQSKILAKKEYGWQKLNENQHVSSMDRQLLLESYRSEQFWIVQVLRTNWSPLQYQLLFSNEIK
ncbi:MAG: hypothetical protein EB101_04130 [Chitinophagia bacterium]|nr:hypothetical protein [Chitinophagia bacterium]